MSKRDFFPLFLAAWEASFKEQAILKAFEVTGLQAFYSISVQKSLLEHEVQGLREALLNERLRRKRGKALPLQEPEDYHGGAIFYSPRKQQQLQKAEKVRQREEARQVKAHAAQAKREARAEAQLFRERLRAERAA
ncbi:hypothetical protein T440DRAFT_363981, partial [Plenodomus tracheiphilus IPT5]